MNSLDAAFQNEIATVLAGHPAWIVGGTIRDELLGRELYDIDLVVDGDVAALSKRLRKRLSAHAFALSDEFGTWRLIDRKGEWQLDISEIRGGSIEADLALRDFTVNALARPVAGGEILDLFGGVSDIENRSLRAVSETSFQEDPLRTLRLVRMGCELGFSFDQTTGELASESVAGLESVAQERVFAELKRIVGSDRAVEGVRSLEELGLLTAVMPEVAALKNIEQSEYHHLDVFEHTLLVLQNVIDLEVDPTPLGPAGPAVARRLSQVLSDELTHWQALRFGALLHDCAKPATYARSDEGRITFFDHDIQGAQLTRKIMRRLRASQKLTNYMADLAEHHLRLGFLVHSAPLNNRQLYEYLNETSPVEVDVTVLSVVDRLATRGRNSQQAIEQHLALADHVLPVALEWTSRERKPLIRGDELAVQLGIEECEQQGAELQELDAARYCGEIETSEEALEHARKWLEANR